MKMVFWVAVGIWTTVEAALIVRGRHQDNGSEADAGTSWQLAVSIAVAIVAGNALASRLDSGPLVVARATGAVFLLAGAALRVWSAVTLGAAFRPVVTTVPGQELCSSGPYRILRHPSYLALEVALFGFGFGMGNPASALAVALLPLPALLRRIRVEERVLSVFFGTRYEAYAARTRRLLPYLW